MKISEILQPQHPSLSFELFPPRDDIGFWDLYKTIEAINPLQPTYVSVTYGAGGKTRRQTVELVGRIKSDVGLEPVAHVTCVGAGRRELAAVLDELWELGIRNILALRGDPPEGQGRFEQPEGGFAHANELAAFAKDRHDFCIGGACHPEGHPEAPDLATDLINLRRKVDSGCEYLVTQLFFNNEDFYRFRDRARTAGIGVPIIAGIMPILSLKQIKRFTSVCGATIPPDLLAKLEAVEDDSEAVRQMGTIHALRQCEDLLEHAAAGIHLYTLNRSTATRTIFQHLRDRLRAPDRLGEATPAPR
jgi:methylenetetrahydrofolate reductase (NADPH)